MPDNYNITDPDILDDLCNLFSSWENVVYYEYSGQTRYCLEYELVIKASNGKHYKAIVEDDTEMCITDFEDTTWTEVTQKEVLVTKWVDV